MRWVSYFGSALMRLAYTIFPKMPILRCEMWVLSIVAWFIHIWAKMNKLPQIDEKLGKKVLYRTPTT
jgi:hypothetical protein